MNDGYEFTKAEKSLLKSSSGRGILYGLLDLSEQLDNGIKWDEISSNSVTAHYPFRAIKFNLPWFSYRSGENLALHYETCRDLKFWESFLEMMVENKFNTLSLWNMHPYMFMVKSELFPKASPFTDQEMADRENFWNNLFKMAKTSHWK